MRRVEWSAFRIAITLLGFAGLRVNEMKDLSLDQLNEFRDKKQIQIYQSKQNKHRTLILSQQGYKMLCGLKKDIQKEKPYTLKDYTKIVISYLLIRNYSMLPITLD